MRERALWRAGVVRVAGVDEAGMGPLAGPVVAAAVIFPPEVIIVGADDSKRLSPRTRDRLSIEIKERALSFAVGEASPREIDRINIRQAGLLAMRRAVLALEPAPEHLLIDARTLPDLPWPQEGPVRGDSAFHVVACASILAKTHRDARMLEYDARYPGYGFARHKGYPTAAHAEALRRLGPCPIHRRSFTYDGASLFDLEGGATRPA
ncbi:MAG: ribonuclease HII [Candidatus Eisenbacteria bacterium]